VVDPKKFEKVGEQKTIYHHRRHLIANANNELQGGTKK